MKILFIGPINFGFSPQGGDQFKNNLLLFNLNKHHEVEFFDSVHLYKNKFNIIKLLRALIFTKHDTYIISLSTKSALKTISTLVWLNIKSEKIVFWVMGGSLPRIVERRKRLVQSLNKLKSIGVQTVKMQNDLRNLGLKNIHVTSNFKIFNTALTDSRHQIINNRNSENLRILFISRISKYKGVDLILEVFENCVDLFIFKHINIDFYGPIENEYETEFNLKVDKIANVNYKGFLEIAKDPDYYYNFLCENYDILLFPTVWPSEGFPGVIIDAVCSGLATIASDWNYNREAVIDNLTGLIIESNNSRSIYEAIMKYKLNTELLEEHRHNALDKSIGFHSDNKFPEYLLTLN